MNEFFSYRLNNSSLSYKIICLIFATIFLQQILVINIGGSFKLYEALSLILVGIFLFDNKIIYSKYSFLLFVFFIVAPLPGDLFYYFSKSKQEYYKRFPEALNQIRFNIYIAPFLIYIYYIFNWVAINYIISSKRVYLNTTKIIRIFVVAGSLTSLYSFYAMFGIYLLGLPDIIPGFIDFRNSKPSIIFRAAGFSIEPGTYVLIQSWVVLYLAFIKDLFSPFSRKMLLFINLISLLLTMSSALIALFVAIIFYFFIRSIKSALITFLFLFILSFPIVTFILNQSDLYFALYQKLEDFGTILFSNASYMGGSGAERALTTISGFKLFLNFPIFGVGGGNSYFYIWRYADAMFGSNNFLTFSSCPQSFHCKVLAELGLFGYIPILLFFTKFIRNTYKKLKVSPLYKVGFIGGISTFGMLFSIYPEYSLFIWINLALIINNLYYSKLQKQIAN